ncbi:MAG: transporter, inner rane subunit [Candidatus Angelobacter sp.]|nr:transporter, inner rane subunit [Candidatus Angelobacter sp.]
MSTQSNAMSESPMESQLSAPAAISAARQMYWAVQRELWENRSIYIAPVAVAAVFLLGFSISMIGLPHQVRGLSELAPMRQRELIQQPYFFIAGLMMLTTFVVGVFYCLDALHGERRDRSILFWKSLPVSDVVTVLSKFSVPLVVLPLVTFVVAVTTQMIMLLLSSVVLVMSGFSVSTLWTRMSFFEMSLMLLYHLMTAHAIWYAPIYGWLLLVSGWARRATFLWAGLPLLAICVIEKVAFNSTHFAVMLFQRLAGASDDGGNFVAGMASMRPLAHLTPGTFLTSPGLWVGLVVAAVFLAAAIRLRRYQVPI